MMVIKLTRPWIQGLALWAQCIITNMIMIHNVINRIVIYKTLYLQDILPTEDYMIY